MKNYSKLALLGCLALLAILSSAQEVFAQCNHYGVHVCRYRGRKIVFRHGGDHHCHHNSCSSNHCNKGSEKPKEEAQMGIKGGLSFSNFFNTNEDINDRNLRRGYHFGLTSRFPVIPRMIYIHADALYSNKGIKGELINSGGEVQFDLNYIEVPVLAAFDIAKGVSIEGGIYGGYLLSAKGAVAGPNLEEYDFNTFDYGYAAGLSFRTNGVGFGARYHYGIREIAATPEAINHIGAAKNSALQLYLVLGLD